MSAAVKLKSNFTQVYNEIIHDTSLSVGARLTLIHMLSKPKGKWQFYTSVIAKEIGVNESTAKGYVRELIAAGYVTRERKRESGRLAGYTYYVYEAPFAVPTDGDISNVEESTPINKELSNTDFKEKQEEEIYNNESTDNDIEEFSVTQEEIYEQAIDTGFKPDKARLFALRSEGIPATITAIHNAFKALIDRMSDRSQPRIVSLPAYFRQTLIDEIERQGIRKVVDVDQLPPVDSDVLFYDWLREEEDGDLPW